MSYAIIGFGNIGQALAKAFARNGIEVSVATTRDPKSFASAAAAIGPTIIPKKLAEAVKADIVFLAVRFESHRDVATALPTWKREPREAREGAAVAWKSVVGPSSELSPSATLKFTQGAIGGPSGTIRAPELLATRPDELWNWDAAGVVRASRGRRRADSRHGPRAPPSTALRAGGG